jgi:hypothetical protein
MRQSLPVLLAWMLCANSVSARPRMLAAFHGSQTGMAQKPTLKEQVLEIPAGSVVEVRLKTKEKLRGRPGDISTDAFTVKLAKGDQIEERKIAFDELKSIKVVEGGSKAGRTALYILAGAGAVLVVLFVVAAVALRGS